MSLGALALAASLASWGSAQPAPPEPRLAPAPPAAGAARAPVEVSFGTDPRVELLSVLVMLARPGAARERFGAAEPPYAAAARKAFARFSGHPAVARLRAHPPSGSRLAELFLRVSPPPALAAPSDPEGASQAAAEADLLREARDFAARSRFMHFYAAHAKDYARLAAEAAAETARGLRPDSLTAYLRSPDAGRHLFVAAPLLPPDMVANVRRGDGPAREYVWVRAADYRKASLLGFDTFGASPAHDVGHSLLDPLGAAHRDELEAASALMFAGCAARWSGCAQEQIDVAVTLRALALERGEAASRSMLRAYAPKYPSLAALCARLREWEASPDARFESFYPRLVDVFREEAAARSGAPSSSGPR